MSRLWLWFLPFLFLPGMGLGVQTPFGTLELIDFLAIPFLSILILSPSVQALTLRGEIKRIGLIFICWAFATILWIHLKYDYEKPLPILIFSLLKLGKFSLYGFIGLSISYHLTSEKVKSDFHVALLGVGLILGTSLAYAAYISQDAPIKGIISTLTYRTNLISAGLSILFVYNLTLYLKNYGTPLWRKLALPTMLIMLLGSTYSSGRGGWAAAVAGVAYVIFHMHVRTRTVFIGIGLLCALFVLYELNPSFQSQVDVTLFPDPEFLKTYNFGIGGVDDGGRITTWLHEIAKFPSSPIFGTGFYHRGEKSGLWLTGSHNFWLQMFLETGLVGGCLILFMVFKMWRHAEIYHAVDPRVSLALKAALITAFIGGLSGEYYYGSYGLLCVILVYACVGAHRRAKT